MGRAVEITRTGLTAQDLRREAGRIGDRRVVQRVLAIARVLEGANCKTAAESCDMDRQTLRDWVHRDNEEGIAGLSDRHRGGVRAS